MPFFFFLPFPLSSGKFIKFTCSSNVRKMRTCCHVRTCAGKCAQRCAETCAQTCAHGSFLFLKIKTFLILHSTLPLSRFCRGIPLLFLQENHDKSANRFGHLSRMRSHTHPLITSLFFSPFSPSLSLSLSPFLTHTHKFARILLAGIYFFFFFFFFFLRVDECVRGWSVQYNYRLWPWLRVHLISQYPFRASLDLLIFSFSFFYFFHPPPPSSLPLPSNSFFLSLFFSLQCQSSLYEPARHWLRRWARLIILILFTLFYLALKNVIRFECGPGGS